MQSGKRGINLQRAEACCTRGSMFTPLLVMEAAVHQRRLCRDFQYGPVYVQRDMLLAPSLPQLIERITGSSDYCSYCAYCYYCSWCY